MIARVVVAVVAVLEPPRELLGDRGYGFVYLIALVLLYGIASKLSPRGKDKPDGAGFVLAVKEWRARFAIDGDRVRVASVASGYRRIAFLGTQMAGDFRARKRLEGFEEALTPLPTDVVLQHQARAPLDVVDRHLADRTVQERFDVAPSPDERRILRLRLDRRDALVAVPQRMEVFRLELGDEGRRLRGCCHRHPPTGSVGSTACL